MKRIIPITAALLLLISLFAGCGSQSETAAGTDTNTGSATASAAASASTDDQMFTDRDREIGYTESECTAISLKDGASSSGGDGVKVEGDTVTITEEGDYILTGSLSDGQICVDAPDDAKVRLILNGVEITNESSAAVYVKNADKVFITTAADTENSLSVTGEFEAIDDNNIDGTIFAKSDLTLNGSGTLTVKCSYGHGIVSKDDLAITSGAYDIAAAEKGLSGKDSVRIADGTLTISAGDDAIHSKNDDDSSLGFVYIAGGSLSISAGDDGIHAESALSILGGTIDVTESYEGLEGLSVDISGGDISVVSSDDGLNAAGGSSDGNGGGPGGGGMQSVEGCYINISGGTVTIDASGDGIDSNGDLTVSGGTITVSGPTDNNNGALDFNGTATITGGTLLASGSSGMAEGFGSSSTQCSILYNLSGSQQAGTTVTLSDENGNKLCEFTPVKQFQSVNISVPGLTQGSSYTLTVGTEEYTIELDSVSYSNGGGGMSGGFGGGQGGGPGGRTGGGPDSQDGTSGPGGGQAPQGFPGGDQSADAVQQ